MSFLKRLAEGLGLGGSQSEVPADPGNDGRLADIGMHVRALQESASVDAFLVIEVAGSDDFLQVITIDDRLRIDYPLLTPRQRSLEPLLRSAAAELGLEVSSSQDGDEFPVVDVDIPEGADAPAVLGRLLAALYGIDAQTPLRFESQL